MVARGYTLDDADGVWLNGAGPARALGGYRSRGALRLLLTDEVASVPRQSADRLEIQGTWSDSPTPGVNVATWRVIGRWKPNEVTGPVIDHPTSKQVYDSIPTDLEDDIISVGTRGGGTVLTIVVPLLTPAWARWLHGWEGVVNVMIDPLVVPVPPS